MWPGQQGLPHRPDEQQEYRNAQNEKRGVRADCGEKSIGSDEGAEDSPGNVDAVGAAGVGGDADRILVDQPRCPVAKRKTEEHYTYQRYTYLPPAPPIFEHAR